MKNMTDRVANKVAGSIRKLYTIDGSDLVAAGIVWVLVERLVGYESIDPMDAVKASKKAEAIVKSAFSTLELDLGEVYEGYGQLHTEIGIGGTRAVSIRCRGALDFDSRSGDNFEERYGTQEEYIVLIKALLKKQGFHEGRGKDVDYIKDWSNF